MRNIFYIAALFLLTFPSCQKVIDLKIDDTEPKMVIEAKYDAVKEEVLVKLSKTINVFSAEDFPMITGAVVQIFDGNGIATPLTDQGDGTYLLQNYSPVYNTMYSIKIDVDGEVYEASDSLVPIVPLDSLTTELQPVSPFSDGGYVVFMHLTDPIGPNFYRAIRKINSEYRTELGDQFMFDDSFTEGNSQQVPLFSELYQVDDTVQVELISYSEKSYIYYQELRAIASGSGASAAPANPSSSWSKEALGHFVTFGYNTKTIVVKD